MEWLWPKRETHILQQLTQKDVHTISLCSWSRANTHNLSASFVATLPSKGFSDNIHAGQNSIYDTFFFFFYPVLAFDEEERLPYYCMLCFFSINSRGIKQYIPLLLDPSEILPWFSTLASNLPHHVLNSWQLVSLLIHTQNPKASAFSLLHVELMGLKFAMLDCQGGKKQTVLPYHRMRWGQRGEPSFRR